MAPAESALSGGMEGATGAQSIQEALKAAKASKSTMVKYFVSKACGIVAKAEALLASRAADSLAQTMLAKEAERLVGIKFNENQGASEVAQHALALVVQSSRSQGLDQVLYCLPLHAQILGQVVVANGYIAWNHLDSAAGV